MIKKQKKCTYSAPVNVPFDELYLRSDWQCGVKKNLNFGVHYKIYRNDRSVVIVLWTTRLRRFFSSARERSNKQLRAEIRKMRKYRILGFILFRVDRRRGKIDVTNF